MLFRTSTLIVAMVFCANLQADADVSDKESDNSVKHLLAFDKAQSARKYADTLAHLSPGVKIAIKSCDGKQDKLDYIKAAKTYKDIFKTASSLEIQREVIKVEKAAEGSGYLVHSKLNEKVMADKKQVQTISQEVAHVKKFASRYQIASIDAKISCEK